MEGHTREAVYVNYNENPLVTDLPPEARFYAEYNKTPPITQEGHAERQPWGLFTPRTIFEKGHVAVRNLFGNNQGNNMDANDVDISSMVDHTMEWETPQLNQTFKQQHPTVPTSRLDQTITPQQFSALNRTFSTKQLNTSPFRKDQKFDRSFRLDRTFSPQRRSQNFNINYPHSQGRSYSSAPFIMNKLASVPMKTHKTPYDTPSRFGNTYPYVKPKTVAPELSDYSGSIKKSILLHTPDRENPLKVDIDVEPHPLTQSQSGEHFVCDITLNMEEVPARKFQMNKAFSPQYHSTPATRFDKTFSPQYVSTPKYYLSQTFSQQRHSSPKSQLNKTFKQKQGYASTFQMNQTDIQTPRSDRTFISQSLRPQLDRTFIKEESPELNRSYTIRKESPRVDRTFTQKKFPTESLSPQLDKTFVKGELPEINRSYTIQKESPQMDKTFIQDTPQINRTYTQKESPGDKTFMKQRESTEFDTTNVSSEKESPSSTASPVPQRSALTPATPLRQSTQPVIDLPYRSNESPSPSQYSPLNLQPRRLTYDSSSSSPSPVTQFPYGRYQPQRLPQYSSPDLQPQRYDTSSPSPSPVLQRPPRRYLPELQRRRLQYDSSSSSPSPDIQHQLRRIRRRVSNRINQAGGSPDFVRDNIDIGNHRNIMPQSPEESLEEDFWEEMPDFPLSDEGFFEESVDDSFQDHETTQEEVIYESSSASEFSSPEIQPAQQRYLPALQPRRLRHDAPDSSPSPELQPQRLRYDSSDSSPSPDIQPQQQRFEQRDFNQRNRVDRNPLGRDIIRMDDYVADYQDEIPLSPEGAMAINPLLARRMDLAHLLDAIQDPPSSDEGYHEMSENESFQDQ